MARQTKTIVSLFDDMTGEPFDASTGGAWDLVLVRNGEAQRFTLDLNEKNDAEFQKVLAKFLAKATPVTAGSKSNGKDEYAAKVREWARENEIEVAASGRLSAAVVQAYEDAHKAA